MNLFFDGVGNRAGISVKASMGTRADPAPAFAPNRASRTMGWPILDIPGAGSLTCGSADPDLWPFDTPGEALEVTLKSFRFCVPEVDGKLDLVGPHKLGPSGRPDFVGQFVLEVARHTPRPSDLLLWLETVPGVTAGGPDRAGVWKRRIGGQSVGEPFSFRYDGEPSHEVLARSRLTLERRPLDADRKRYTLRYLDPETGLEVTWDGVEYPEFRTVEWTLFFKNTGPADTPLLADILALDTRLPCPRSSVPLLHYSRGDTCSPESFEPLTKRLGPGEELHEAPTGGRPTNGAFPYFNLRAGSEGVIIVVGWPGQWAAGFSGERGGAVHITAGQERTRFKLHPSETVRTPLVVLQFTVGGDWIDAQNQWRRWMVRHNIPRPGGQPLKLPQFNACSSHQFAEMTRASEANQKEFIDAYLAKGLQLDYWWMDAGWYVGAEERNWTWTGTWDVDRRPHRFPNGLRAISDHAHAKDVKTLVWFEPERVAAGTWLASEHPEWILGGAGGGLLDLGNAEARSWLVEHVDRLLTEEGIDLYRQDFNMDPLEYWRRNDAADRQGITENRHVMGYLAYWDELLRRRPRLLIDSCASGGRRNDLETLRRAVPLLRSDYLFEPVGQQGHTYGLSFWVPFYGTGYCPSNTVGWGWGTGGISYDSYTRRSNMCPANTACFDFRVDVDDELIRKLYREWLEVAPDFFGDYYPLTEYSLDPETWIAWQFHRPAAGRGFVQAFRRAGSDYFGGQFRLRGLDPDARYTVTNLDLPGSTSWTGRQLLETGMEVIIRERPGAATVVYRESR
jgi:alpha-galactosidase